MTKNSVRKQRIRHYDALVCFIDALEKQYGLNIVSIIAMGSWGTEEATKEADVDLEVIFDSKFFKPELTEELHSVLKKLNLENKIEAWALDEKKVTKGTYVPDNYPLNVFNHHLKSVGLVLRGKNLLKGITITKIPEHEIKELFSIILRDFQQGGTAKAVLKGAFAYVLKQNGGLPIEIKNHLYYRGICEAAQKYLDEKHFAIVYKALRAKRGLGVIDKAEAMRFLKFIEKELKSSSAT